MIAVSQEFKDILKQDLIKQKVKGKVYINYSNPFLDNSLQHSSTPENRISALSQTSNGRYKTSYKYFSLDESFTLGDDYHPCPDTDELKYYTEMGWWSAQISDENGYFEESYPSIELDFDMKPVSEIRVIGDDKRNEYPVEFEIYFFDRFYSPIKVINVVENDEVYYINELEEVVSEVEKVKLIIRKWSKPNTSAKIIEFQTALFKEYTNDEILSLSLTENKQGNYGKSIFGNIGYAEIDLTLDNSNRVFDVNNLNSNIRNLILPNRRIEPYLGVEKEDNSIEYVPLGIFYSDDFESSEDDIKTSIHGWNRLQLLENSEYRMNEIKYNYSFYYFFKDVLNSAGFADYQIFIDDSLKNSEYIIPVCYIEPDTHLAVLEKMCMASLANLYVDRKEIVRVEGIKYVIEHSFKKHETLTAQEYYNKNNPFKYNDLINKIKINTLPLTLQPEDNSLKEIFKEKYTFKANEEKTIIAEYKDLPGLNQEINQNELPAVINVISVNHFPDKSLITIKNTSETELEVEILVRGKFYKNKYKKTIASQNDFSIKKYGEIKLNVEENELIQTELLAEHIALKLLDSYEIPDNELELTFIGNPALELNDRLEVNDKYTSTHYFINSLKLEFDEGVLSSSLTGKKSQYNTGDTMSLYGDDYYGIEKYKE